VNGPGRRKIMSIEEVKELKLIRALMFKSTWPMPYSTDPALI